MQNRHAGRPPRHHRPPEDAAVVVDAKTGNESPSHTVQVMIYLYAVPKALRRYRNAKLRGQVTYATTLCAFQQRLSMKRSSQNLGALIRRLSADEPARRVPSPQECRFCNITAADCPDRVDPPSTVEAATTDDF